MVNDKTPTNKRSGEGKSGTEHQNGTRRRNRGNAEKPDWSSADAKLLLRVVASIAGIGGAVQFGYTRNADQYTIRILGDGEPFNEYLRPTEDVDYWLESIAQDYELDGTRPEEGA